jgi:hypothetical protein
VEAVLTATLPPGGEFRLATQQVGADVWVLTLSGDCGKAAATELTRHVATLDGNPTPMHAVLDLTGAVVVRTGFCDELVTSARAARDRGVAMTVVTEDAVVRKRLEGPVEDGAMRVDRLFATAIRNALIASMP